MKELGQNKIIVGFLLVLLSTVASSQTDFQLEVSPNGNPIQIPAGSGNAILTYTVTNNGPFDEADQLTLTFNIDPSIEPASATAIDQNWSCFSQTGQVICDYFNIFPELQSSSIQLSITPPQAEVLVPNAIQATIANAIGDSNPGNESLSSNIDFVPAGGVDLQIAKTISTGFPTTVAPGDSLNFDLVVSNLSAIDATNVTVNDDILLTSLLFDANNSSPECTQVSGVECRIDNLPAGNTVTFTLATTVDINAQPGNETNTATVSSTEPDIDFSNNNTSQGYTIAVGGGPEIQVLKSTAGNVTQVVQGGTLDYLVEINNTGVGNALNVNFTDTLPAGVSYVSHMPLGPNFNCTFVAPTLTCDAPSLPNTVDQDGVRITVLADGNINSLVTNTATSSFVDSNSADNSASSSFTITAPVADLDLTMSADSLNYNVGDLITLDLTLHNPFSSTGAPTNTVVSTTLPNEVVFNAAQVTNVNGWSCLHDGSATGGLVDCSSQGNPVAIGTNTFIQITATANTVGTTVFPFANVVSDFDSNPSNDDANVSFAINPADADLSVLFNSVSGIYNQGDSIIYDIQVANSMASTTSPSDSRLDVTLPAEVVYVATDLSLAPGWQCTHDGSLTGGQMACDRNGSPFVIGTTDDMTIEVQANSQATNAVVQASVSSSADTNLINNTANQADVINVVLTTTITADKTASLAGVNVSSVNYGQSFEYVLLVNNTGLNDAVNVNVKDTLPNDVTLLGFDTTGWNCLPLNINAVGGILDCTLNNALSPSGSAQIILNVMATNNTSVTSITNKMDALGVNTGAMVSSTNTLNLSTAAASLQVSQTPVPATLNNPVDFTVVLNNTGNSTLSGIQIDNVMPADFTFNSFTADVGVSCAENTGVISCIVSNPLLVGDFITLSLNLTAPTALVANQAYVLQTTADALELSAPVSNNLNVAFESGDFNVSMFSNLAEVNAGELFMHTANISNTGNLGINMLTSNFAFPLGAEVTEVQTTEMSCQTVNQAVSCVANQPLLPGDRISVSYLMVADGSVTPVTTHVRVNATGLNKSASTSTQIIGQTTGLSNDISLLKTASVTEIGLQSEFNYIFEVTNNGSETQNNFMLNDDLPAGVVFLGFSGNDWNCAGNTSINCQYTGSLVSQASSQLIFDVMSPDVTGSLSNTAAVTLNDDENPANNQSSNVVQVLAGTGTPVADLAVTITTDQTELFNTEVISWDINVINNGPGTADGVVVSYEFPVGFIVGDVTVNDGVNCIILANSLSCSVASLGVDMSQTINLNGTFSNSFSGLVVSVVEVGSVSVDPVISNNLSTVQVNVLSANDLTTDLALELLSDMQTIQQGGMVDLSFKATNFGPDRAVSAQINATFSGLISQIQVLNSGQWLCQVSTTTMQCDLAGALNLNESQIIDLRIITQEVVQQSQPVVFNAMIESSAIDPHLTNNMVGISNEVTATPTEDEIFDLFELAVGSGASETVLDTIQNVSSYCAKSYFLAIDGLCEEIIASATPENGAAIIETMQEIRPNEVIGQSTSAAEIIASQYQNIGSRLSELRGGGGSGFSVAGLNGRYGNESIPFGMLAYLNQSESEQQAVNNINDFVSPWGLFVNGTISMGERDATGRELGFDYDTFGLTAGVDYRFSPTKVAGVALGYASFDSEIEDQAEMKSTGLTLTGYGSFAINDNFYVDARISYGEPDFEQKRRIQFDLADISVDRVATGKTDASQYSIAMSMGYNFNKKAWNITPNASLRYVKTNIDAFSETGAGGFNFAFGEQEIKSMVWSVGTSVSKAISLKNGVISPQFDINLSRETENDGGLIEAKFLEAPLDEIFLIQTDSPDRTYGSAGIGLVFIGANGKQAYINYRSIFGLEGFTRGTINIGARFEF